MNERPAAAAGVEPSLSSDDLRVLATAGAHPQDASAKAGVELVQTHLSHVFLTGERVYKFRKSVDLGFVCFSARSERNADCLREVALNRRLAPDVYLGVAPLLRDPVRIGPVAEALLPPPDGGPEAEHCVVMRRLPEGRDALSLLARGALTDTQLERAALRIARFHHEHRLGTPAPFSSEQWRRLCVGPVDDNLRLLAQAAPDHVAKGALSELAARARAFVAAHAERFERRRLAGRAVDAHGDLHLQHLWYEQDDIEPIAIDCLEFSESLRRIDAAAEVAFPAMDLRYRAAEAAAERFLRSYARESDDFDLYGVVDYFASYRAGVRAKVASLAAADATIEPEQRERAAGSARRHLELALELLTPRGAGSLVLVGGVVGTGKSTAAAKLADALAGVVIASDRVRKRQAGLAPTARSGVGIDVGLYAPAQTEAVYSGLVERAAPVVDSGRVALLDATWSRAAERERAHAFAQARGIPLLFIETRCEASVALERLARREAAGRDASDAGPAFFARSVERFEPLHDWPAAHQRVLHTDRDGWEAELRAIADAFAKR